MFPNRFWFPSRWCSAGIPASHSPAKCTLWHHHTGRRTTSSTEEDRRASTDTCQASGQSGSPGMREQTLESNEEASAQQAGSLKPAFVHSPQSHPRVQKSAVPVLPAPALSRSRSRLLMKPRMPSAHVVRYPERPAGKRHNREASIVPPPGVHAIPQRERVSAPAVLSIPAPSGHTPHESPCAPACGQGYR